MVAATPGPSFGNSGALGLSPPAGRLTALIYRVFRSPKNRIELVSAPVAFVRQTNLFLNQDAAAEILNMTCKRLHDKYRGDVFSRRVGEPKGSFGGHL